jgi:hypothetical protein
MGAMFFKGFKHVVGRILRDYFSRAVRSSKILMWWLLQKRERKKPLSSLRFTTLAFRFLSSVPYLVVDEFFFELRR